MYYGVSKTGHVLSSGAGRGRELNLTVSLIQVDFVFETKGKVETIKGQAVLDF
jgi:hypothetical protein